MPKKKEKFLVFGGAGFIGSHVSKKLLEQGHNVAIFDLFLQYLPSQTYNYQDILQYRLGDLIRKNVKIYRGDARYKENVEEAIDEFKPDRIIHLAAIPLSNISNVYIDEAIESTIISTTNILQVIRKRDFVKRFIYTSSSMVYGDFKYVPADENHPTNPKDIYGGVKLSGEVMTKVFHERFGIEYTIIRPSAVYGPSDINQRVSQIFLESAMSGKEITINGADAKLDFTYVEDLAGGFVLASTLPKGANETFNMTYGNGRSLLEYVSVIKKYFPNIKLKIVGVDKKNPARGTLDISKAKKLLGYSPKFNLEKGIENYIKFKKQNENSSR